MTRKIKNSVIIHPYLFAGYPALFLFFRNMGAISPVMAFKAVSLIIIAAGALVWLLSRILKNRVKSGLVVSLAVLWFFFFRVIYETAIRLNDWLYFYSRTRYAVAIWTLFFAACAIVIIMKRADFKNLNKIFNFSSVTLIVFSFLINDTAWFPDTAVKTYAGYKKPASDNALSGVSEKQRQKGAAAPDIYYIILDSYSRYDILKDYFNFENKEFYDYLRRKGFYIAEKSLSNYDKTITSLTSSLSMNYLSDNLAAENNNLTEIFKRKGYRVVHINFNNDSADENIAYESPYSFKKYIFYKYLVDMSILYQFQNVYPMDLDYIKNGVEYSFAQLARVSAYEGPKYVFAYICCPHPPFFIYGPNGEGFSVDKIPLLANQGKIYTYHIMYLNRKLKEAIDTILSNSRKSPIIILQADHGSVINNFSPSRLSQEYLIPRTAILNAYYLPGNGKELLYSSISPINTFRVILNRYFDENYEILKDESWVTSDDKKMTFINVMDKLKTEKR